ncbi:MAG: nuclear transport factor 2 family protein [Nitrospira sp.]
MNRQPYHHRPFRLRVRTWLLLSSLLGMLCVPAARAEEFHDPETALRRLVQANAERDLATMSKYMSHDVDAIGYTIDGRKYIGWPDLAADMRSEFDSVVKLEIPITSLHMWTKGDIAWFAMESNYIRYTNPNDFSQRMVLPLRETGVLERRNGRWILVAWHESTRHHDSGTEQTAANGSALLHRASDTQPAVPNGVDLSGEWEVTEIEDNKKYVATLNAQGTGPYTWQGGQFSTTSFNDRRWQGTWKQTGNDREGAFEVVLSEDGTEAKGIWWYVRVGTRNNIPPRQHGGSYLWKRLTPPPTAP